MNLQEKMVKVAESTRYLYLDEATIAILRGLNNLPHPTPPLLNEHLQT